MGHILLSKTSQEKMVAAIQEAEMNTSGEIRVHIDSVCKNDPFEKAIQIFDKLKMYETEQRNAVLIYVAYKSHKLSIIGDSGINKLVPENFWDGIKNQMILDFSQNKPVEAICTAVKSVGESLKNLFPYQLDDINEQSNEISFGE